LSSPPLSVHSASSDEETIVNELLPLTALYLVLPFLLLLICSVLAIALRFGDQSDGC